MLKIILSRRSIPAWLILLAGLLATIFATVLISKSIEDDATKQFAFSCDQITLKINERLNAYALALRGTAARFAGHKTSVDRQTWRAYIETIQIRDSIPGTHRIGFSQLIPPDQITSHIAHIRSEGFNKYNVHPSGKRDFYTSVIYLEPFDDKNLLVFGYDMYSDPTRRAAMEHARDTGKATLTGKIKLLQDANSASQPATLMYFPVYRNGMATETVDQRRGALVGWVFGAYRINDLMIGILGDLVSGDDAEGNNVELHIFDGIKPLSENLLYSHNMKESPESGNQFHQTRIIEFNGHQWLLGFDKNVSLFSISSMAIWLTLSGGLTLSILLFSLSLSVIHSRELSKLISNDLNDEKARIQILLKMSPLGIAYHEMIYDISGKPIDYRFLYANESFTALTGTDPVGKTVRQVFPGIQDDPFDWIGTYDRVIQTGESIRFEQQLQSTKSWYECVAYRFAPNQFVVTFLDVSKRKQAELGLRESEVRYNTLFDENSVPMLLINPAEGNIVDANSQACTFYGWSKTQLKSMNIGDINTLDHVLLQPKFELAKMSERRQINTQHRQANGTVCDVEVFSGPVIIDGKTFVLTSIHDITKRKEAELALHASEERYSVLFDLNVVPMLLVDVTDGKIVDANQQSSTFYGWDIATLRTMNIRDINTLGTVQLRAELGRALHFNKRLLHFQHRRANGELRDVEFISGPVKIGEKYLLLASINDISTRKLTEQALRESKDLNATIINSLTERIIVIDSVGVIRAINKAWEFFPREDAIFEPSRTWLGINFLDVFGTVIKCMNEVTSTSTIAEIRQVLSGIKEHYSIEYPCYCAAEMQWFIIHVIPLQSAPSGAVIMFENITKRKLSEIEISTARERLAELTSKLIVAHEQERKNLAMELHDDMGQGFAMLNINLHMMRKYLGNASAESYWKNVNEDVTLLIAKMRTISGALRPPTLDYLGLETAVKQLLKQHFSNTQITCVLEYAGLPKKLPEQTEISVYRIIQESITNIVRHAEASHVIVEINGGDNADEIEITVRDNGKGFDTKRIYGRGDFGLSFGLIGMTERTKLIGGEFQVTSTIGEGTRILATIPLK